MRSPLIAVGAAMFAASVSAQTGAGVTKPALPGEKPAAAGGSGVTAGPKAGKPPKAVAAESESGKVKQVSPANPASDALNPPVPDAEMPAKKSTGEQSTDQRAGVLPASGSVPKAALKPGEGLSGEGGLFDPTLTDDARRRFRTGTSRGTERFPIWQDPGLPERNREMGMDLLRNPFEPQRTEETSQSLFADESADEAIPFIAPGLYGRAPNVLFPGSGRLAGPLSFRGGVSLINGYDSNGFQVADNAQTSAALEQEGSFTTGLGIQLDILWSRPRQVFTLALSTNATYYWNRKKDKTLFNIPTWVILYSSQFDNRTQLSISFSLNYLAQPDYANVYASQYGGGQSYLTTSSQITVSRKWARHLSTDTSLALNLLYYPDGNGELIAAGIGSTASGNQLGITIGNAFRFETSKKLTWVVEGRYALQDVLENSALNSDSLYFLVGLDWIWLRRVSTTVRVGGEFRTSTALGNSSSPYFEFSGNCRTGRRSSVGFNARYGLQFADIAGNQGRSFNFGLNYQQTLGRKLSGTAGLSYVHNGSSQTVLSNVNNPINVLSNVSDAFTLNLGLTYQVHTRLSLGANYSYSRSSSSFGQQDFGRSVASISANWSF